MDELLSQVAETVVRVRMTPQFALMSRISKNSMISTGVLITLGFIALYAGPASLIVLIPAAVLVWYRVRPVLTNDRN